MAEAKLAQQTIIDAAFDLLNDVGLDQFKLRALAARLSVSATALYWHFSNKDELMTAMVNRFYFQAYARIAKGTDPQSCLLILGRDFCQALNKCRDGARLCAIAIPTKSGDPVTNSQKISAPLVQQGYDKETALSHEAAVLSFVLGWSIYNQNKLVHAHLDSMFDFTHSFEIGLQAMIKGLVNKS